MAANKKTAATAPMPLVNAKGMMGKTQLNMGPVPVAGDAARMMAAAKNPQNGRVNISSNAQQALGMRGANPAGRAAMGTTGIWNSAGAKPAAAAASAVAPAAAAAQQAAAPSLRGRLGAAVAPHRGKILGGAAAGALLYGGYRASRAAGEQDARNQDYLMNAQHRLNAPMPSMSVYASLDEPDNEIDAEVKLGFEKFAQQKLADSPYYIAPSAQSAMGAEIGKQFASKLITDPIDAIQKSLKKKLMDEPKWQANFHTVVHDDPELTQFHQEDPDSLQRAFGSMKRMSPTLAKDYSATANFLKQTVLSGGKVDIASLKLLADIEKATADAKRR